MGRFELADGGTLFLDEIANISLNLQAKLLRVLETGEFERVGSSRTRRANVRIISATNADLTEEVRAGRFRQDLLFRLNTIEIPLPPLRDRREDIPLLARHFLQITPDATGSRSPGSTPPRSTRSDHAWPGNVRELDHAVERAVLMAELPTDPGDDLGLRGRGTRLSRLDDMSLDEVEGFLIKKAMARFDGNVSQAAKALGLSRSALYRRLQHHKLSDRRYLHHTLGIAAWLVLTLALCHCDLRCITREIRSPHPVAGAGRRLPRRGRVARDALVRGRTRPRSVDRRHPWWSPRGSAVPCSCGTVSPRRCRRWPTCWPRCASAISRSARGARRERPRGSAIRSPPS